LRRETLQTGAQLEQGLGKADADAGGAVAGRQATKPTQRLV